MILSKGTEATKLSHEEFTKKAITSLRKEGYKGIHSVYSGFNSAFKAYYGTNPVDATNALQKSGKIAMRPVKGGVMIYLPQDATAYDRSGSVLEKMGLKK